MWRIFAADVEILVHRGCIYFPLIRDPDIDQEIQTPVFQKQLCLTNSPLPVVLSCQNRLFLQAVTASSLVENFSHIFPEAFEKRRRALRDQGNQVLFWNYKENLKQWAAKRPDIFKKVI